LSFSGHTVIGPFGVKVSVHLLLLTVTQRKQQNHGKSPKQPKLHMHPATLFWRSWQMVVLFFYVGVAVLRLPQDGLFFAFRFGFGMFFAV
jgi:hypothetical protein